MSIRDSQSNLQPRILHLPPSNRLQANLICREIYDGLEHVKGAGRRAILLYDMNNKDYSSSLRQSILEGLQWGTPKAIGAGWKRSTHGDWELMIKGYRPDTFKLDWRELLLRIQESHVLILAGMFDFVTPILIELESDIPKGKVGEDRLRIIATDGVVNGPINLVDVDVYSQVAWDRTRVNRIAVTFPQTCLRARDDNGKNLHTIRDPRAQNSPIREAINGVLECVTKYKDHGDDDVDNWLEDPNHGFYVCLGSYFVGECWHGLDGISRHKSQVPLVEEVRDFLNRKLLSHDSPFVNCELPPFGPIKTSVRAEELQMKWRYNLFGLGTNGEPKRWRVIDGKTHESEPISDTSTSADASEAPTEHADMNHETKAE